MSSGYAADAGNDFLGLEEAKNKARSLVDQAVTALSSFGEDANVLIQAAHFMIERKK